MSQTLQVSIPRVLPETPAWADTFGVDGWGLFAGIRIAETTQMLRWIEPGSFTMGSPPDEHGHYDDEGPQHEVTIGDGFWIGQTPVTQAFLHAVSGDNPSRFKNDLRQPVESVNWDVAVEFCGRLAAQLVDFEGMTVRLPSEAEWEYACRAGTTSALYNGQELTTESGACPNLSAIAWYKENSGNASHAVGEKEPNRWGLYDMLGNVWEWCADRWHPNYEGAPADGRPWLSGSRDRVNRGGSWANDARECRSACRARWDPARYSSVGFRLVLAPRSSEDSGSFS